MKIYTKDFCMCVPRYICLDNKEFFQKEIPFHFINPFEFISSNGAKLSIKSSYLTC